MATKMNIGETKAPSQVTSADSLADEINREHQSAIAAASTALEHARRCGELLIEAKQQLGHGKWLPWLAENCTVGERQARNYMRITRNWDVISNRQRASEMSVRQALALTHAEPHAEVDISRIPDLVTTIRDHYPEFEGVHPACLTIPMCSEDEFDRIVASVEAFGLIKPIMRFNGQLLDGKIRLLACYVANQRIRVVDASETKNPWDLVISLNLARQHLSLDQLAAVAVDLFE